MAEQVYGNPIPEASTAPTETPNTAPAEESSETADTEEGELTPEADAALVAAGGAKQAANPAKAAVKKALRELSLKIDGKSYQEKLPFDLPDDPEAIEYMQRQLQMGKMGQQRAQQAAELQKEIVSWVEQLRKNPRAALSMPNLGVDLKKLAQEVIEQEIADSKKSPEQLQKEQLEQEIKMLKEQQDAEKKSWEQREFERLQEQAYNTYETKMIQALDQTDLPKSPYVVKKMAEYMLLGLQSGKDLQPEDVLPLVREEITSDIREMFAVMPAEVVEKLVGKDKLNDLRKKKVAKAKTPPPTPISKSIQDVGNTKKSATPAKRQSYKDFFKV